MKYEIEVSQIGGEDVRDFFVGLADDFDTFATSARAVQRASDVVDMIEVNGVYTAITDVVNDTALAIETTSTAFETASSAIDATNSALSTMSWAETNETLLAVTTNIGRVQSSMRGLGNGFSTLARDMQAVESIDDFGTVLRSLPELMLNTAQHGFNLGGSATEIIKSFGALKVVFAKILVPIALIIAAVVGLIYWWKTLGDRNSDLKDRFLVLWENIRTAFDNAVGRIRDSLGGMAENFSELWERISPVVDVIMYVIGVVLAQVFERTLGAISAVIASVINIVSGWVDYIIGFIDVIIGIFTGDLGRIQDGVSRIFDGLMNIIGSTVSAILALFVPFPGEVFDTIMGVVDGIVEWGDNIIRVGIQAVSDFVNNVVDFFKGLPNRIMEAISDLRSMISDFFGNLFGNLPGLGNLFGGRSARATMETFGQNMMQGMAHGMAQAAGEVQRVFDATMDMVEKGLYGAGFNNQLTLAVTSADASYHHQLLERIATGIESGKNIIMDTGELVGATASGIDYACGKTISYKQRWGR